VLGESEEPQNGTRPPKTPALPCSQGAAQPALGGSPWAVNRMSSPACLSHPPAAPAGLQAGSACRGSSARKLLLRKRTFSLLFFFCEEVRKRSYFKTR